MKYKITDQCVSCGFCADVCKYNAIVQGDGLFEITDKCVGCGDCVDSVCPAVAIISIPNSAIFIRDKIAKKFYVGDKQVRAVYAGTAKVWPSVVRVDRGEDYGEWIYNDHGTGSRSRTVTPWEQDIYSDGSVGERRMGTPYTQEEAATPTVMWDGVTYWNGSCGTDYYYVDYQKVRTRYAYSDGVVRYSGYWNGTSRSRRIDGQCGWVRSTVVVSDWANTGQLCNAAGTIGAYDCDGNYSVQYYRQSRILEDRYPDGTGGINSRTEYRVGGVASRTKVDGQCGWVRSTVVVSDWANTGVLCKANAQAGYDCDGTYRVQYQQQRRTLEDRYPDGTGGINRRDEYRAGSLASRQQVDGYCGYQSRTVRNSISDVSYDMFYEFPNIEHSSPYDRLSISAAALWDYDDAGDSFSLRYKILQEIRGSETKTQYITDYSVELIDESSDNCVCYYDNGIISLTVSSSADDAYWYGTFRINIREGNDCFIEVQYSWDGEN